MWCQLLEIFAKHFWVLQLRIAGTIFSETNFVHVNNQLKISVESM